MAARGREVTWAESARDALDEVITYIVQDSRQAAGHVLEAAIEAAASLATLSERGRVVPEINDSAIRESSCSDIAWWYENGRPSVEGQYLSGEKVGVWRCWDAAGTIHRERHGK